MNTLVVDGVRLAYTEAGSGEPIVCLHAIGHDARDFARLASRLAPRRRVLALDWPGQGRSGPDGVPASAARYAELLAGALTQLGVARCVLVGNSIGGAAAIVHAARHPERVRGLVLENPGGLAPTDDRAAQAVLALMARFFAAGARGARWYPAAYAAYYRWVVLPTPAARAARERIVHAGVAAAPILEQAWRSFARPEADIRTLAPAVRCPVLFAWAERDRFVALARSRAAIDAFPDARLVRYRAGHAAHLEQPDAFERDVERFLDALAPSEADPVRAVSS